MPQIQFKLRQLSSYLLSFRLRKSRAHKVVLGSKHVVSIFTS